MSGQSRSNDSHAQIQGFTHGPHVSFDTEAVVPIGHSGRGVGLTCAGSAQGTSPTPRALEPAASGSVVSDGAVSAARSGACTMGSCAGAEEHPTKVTRIRTAMRIGPTYAARFNAPRASPHPTRNHRHHRASGTRSSKFIASSNVRGGPTAISPLDASISTRRSPSTTTIISSCA